jgi:hypothetical protein
MCAWARSAIRRDGADPRSALSARERSSRQRIAHLGEITRIWCAPGLFPKEGTDVEGKKDRRIRSDCRLACVLAGLIFFARYQPAVVAGPGYDAHWPTRPAGAWAAITKSYQSFIETRTCEYTVLGWGAECKLYC